MVAKLIAYLHERFQLWILCRLFLLFFALAGKRTEKFHHEEERERDKDEVYECLQKGPESNLCPAANRDDESREIYAADEQTYRWRDDATGECGRDLPERCTDDDTDREVYRIPFHRERLEIFE